MRTITMAAVALGAAMLTPPAAQAGVPVTGGPEGEPCRYVVTKDPNPESDANDVIGVVVAGPATTDEPGTMVCTLQYSSTHDGGNAWDRGFSANGNNVIFGSQNDSHSTPEDVQMYICTSFEPDDPSKPTLYWTEEPAPRWHTDPSKECSPATSVGAPASRAARSRARRAW